MALRTGNISVAQKEELIKFMRENPKLTVGKFSSNFTIQDGQNLWKKCANILNAIPGANKDWIHWRKTWQDVRKGVKNKNAKLKKEVLMTGGGPPPDVQFDPQETAVLEMLSTSQLEGHINICESDTSFDFGDNKEISEKIFVEEGTSNSPTLIERKNENVIPEPEISETTSNVPLFIQIGKNKEDIIHEPGPSSSYNQIRNNVLSEHDYPKHSRGRQKSTGVTTQNKEQINIELVRLSEKKFLSESQYRTEKIKIMKLEYERKVKKDKADETFQGEVVSLLKDIVDKLK